MLELLQPLCAHIAQLDLRDPDSAQDALRAAFPDLGPYREAILAASELTPRQASPNVRFGRVAKPGPGTHGLSIDAVEMSGAAAEHTHPNGEVSLCFSIEGDARFMGQPDGWVVAAPGSRHVPIVTGGRMRIVYFLPDGAMIWH